MHAPDESNKSPFHVELAHRDGKFVLLTMSRASGGETVISCDLDQLAQLRGEIDAVLQAAEHDAVFCDNCGKRAAVITASRGLRLWTHAEPRAEGVGMFHCHLGGGDHTMITVGGSDVAAKLVSA